MGYVKIFGIDLPDPKYFNQHLKKSMEYFNYLLGSKSGKGYDITCTKCGSHYLSSKIHKMNDVSECEQCGSKLIYKSIAQRTTDYTAEDCIHFIEKHQGSLMIRTYYIYSRIDIKGVRTITHTEAIRQVNIDCDGRTWRTLTKGMYTANNLIRFRTEDYRKFIWKPETRDYDIQIVHLNWKSARRGSYYQEYTYDMCGAVSAYGLDDILAGTKYQYCQIQMIIKNKYAVSPRSYFETFASIPKIEILVKMGLHRTALEICSARRPQEEANAVFENMKFILEHKKEIIAKERNIEFIKTWALVGKPEYAERLIKDRAVTAAIELFTRWHIGIDAFMSYYLKQATNFYISDYLDMLHNLHECGRDLKDTKNIFPYDFKARHDESTKLARMKRNEKFKEGIIKAFEEISTLEWSDDHYLIRPVKDSDELTAEAVTLNHCVDGYAARIASRETSIFLLRSIEEPDKPLVTVEYKDKAIAQARGQGNKDCEKDQKAFLDEWLKHIRNTKKKAPQRSAILPAAA